MTTVSTVRGPVDDRRLGAVLMHEHVFLFWHDLLVENRSAWDEDAAVQRAVDQLGGLYAAGISTIVDLTVLGTGRNTPLVQRVAAQTAVNIVVAAGVYAYVDLPLFLYRHAVDAAGRAIATWEATSAGPDPLTSLFIKEIEEGIGDTGVRAGILKVATDWPGVTPGNERMLRAVARAQLATGVPISTHSNATARTGLAQQAVFRSEGVDPSRVVIGHSGDSDDLDYLLELIDGGTYLGMDRFGMDSTGTFEQRVNTVTELCKRGYADRLVLAHDASCVSHGAGDRKAGMLASQPSWHMLHISRDVLPELLRRGVSQDDIDQMLIRNPAAILPPRTT